ncbi:hypothetical protein SISSUDRAFT_1030878 [Sistotremastrum suecicum HHB10207 ss-3]|uniref:Uncharacterized protein n=1 Tax=Sistotremastrum suecicum HHB10207 ss-3 TaxID=1314776 RepID=A0A166GRI0_9AGAM|nr:hypothetical protein SISSUDRAFT_1030878 [Sistotremastrum suecicum HHB10207 ss-3]
MGTPPAYNQPQPAQPPISGYQYQYHSIPVYNDAALRDKEAQEARRRTRKRFCGALVIAIVVCILFGSITGSIEEFSKRHDVHRRPSWDDWGQWDHWYPNTPHCDTHWQEEDSAHGHPHFPVEVPDMPDNHWSYPDLITSKITFYLPLSSSDLFFDGRGSTYGNLLIETSDDVDEVVVEIEAFYYTTQRRDSAKICKVKRGTDGEGVAIYTPRVPGKWRREDQITYTVTVTFPSARALRSSRPTYINSFETSTSIFKHAISASEHDLVFGNLKLRTSNSGITSHGVYAVRGDVQTSNGPIIGKFYTNGSLDIVTSNGPVEIETFIANDVSSTRPSSLYVKSSNAHIRAANSLFIANTSLTSAAASNGSYALTFETSNSPVSVSFPISPVSSVLSLTTKTSNAPLDVSLNAAYEGPFHAATSSWFKVNVKESGDSDPSGEGRKRRVNWSNVGKGGSEVEGDVEWVSPEKTYGHNVAHRASNVELKTSNSHIALTV